MAENSELALQLKAGSADHFTFSVNEGSSIEPIDLKPFVDNPTSKPLKFTAELVLGGELPKGLTCSSDGIITGAPEKGSANDLPYDVLIITECEDLQPLIFDIYLTIASSESQEATGTLQDKKGTEADAMKSEYGIIPEQLEQFWALFSDDLSHPDLKELLTRRVTPADIYHLLGRFATLTIWNADDISPAVNGKLMGLKEASAHYLVYDFGVALIATPKELYSSERTIEDSLQTARAMIREIQRREWNIQLAGYDKMVTAAWVEANRLNSLKKGHEIRVEYYEPTVADQNILRYSLSSQAQ